MTYENGANSDVERAKKVLVRYRQELNKKYFPKQIGIGYKLENGRITNKVALVFYVDKKLRKEELQKRGIQPLPEEIEGIPTDVIEVPGGFKPRNEKIKG